MREERGQLPGNVLVTEPLDLWGKVGGDVRVAEDGKLYVRGAIYGDLVVGHNGRCHVFGRIAGSVTVERGAKAIISGYVGGDVINIGGRLYIESPARITGRLRATSGKTTVEPKFYAINPQHKPVEKSRRKESSARVRKHL